MAYEGRTRRGHGTQGEMVNADAPLYERDPQAWRAYLAEGNAKQPRKRVSADVILRDHAGRILLVDPQYKPDWDTPGGMAEANEPPHERKNSTSMSTSGRCSWSIGYRRMVLGMTYWRSSSTAAS